jgi:hypothetical protein
MSDSPAHDPLLAHLVPPENVVPGSAYVVQVRNSGVGVAVVDGGQLGYVLHLEKLGRNLEKLGRSFLATEWDWDRDPQFGTAIHQHRTSATSTQAPTSSPGSAAPNTAIPPQNRHALTSTVPAGTTHRTSLASPSRSVEGTRGARVQIETVFPQPVSGADELLLTSPPQWLS